MLSVKSYDEAFDAALLTGPPQIQIQNIFYEHKNPNKNTNTNKKLYKYTNPAQAQRAICIRCSDIDKTTPDGGEAKPALLISSRPNKQTNPLIHLMLDWKLKIFMV